MIKKLNSGQWIGGIVILASLFLIAFQATKGESSVTFYTPEEVYQNPHGFKGKLFRVSGLVVKGSKIWDKDLHDLRFQITDLQGHDFFVHYKGIPPDLFKEGQGVVLEGKLEDVDQKPLRLEADLLMVKHSEVYDTKQDHSKENEMKLLKSMSVK